MKYKGTVITKPFLAGQIVRKANYTTFGNANCPVVKIKDVRKLNQNKWVLNKRIVFKIPTDLVVIDKLESERLQNIYKNLVISEPQEKDIEKTCYTTYTGERTEKVKYSDINHLRAPLFRFLMTRPDEHFTAYKCPNCGFYHIGKMDDLSQTSI